MPKKDTQKNSSNALRFIALSGTTAVTENLYIYEYGNDMIIVDCGVGFPDAEMYGVDLKIPDFTYIYENKEKLRGVLVTHGHEDHLGAVPFLLKDIDTTVFATKLTAGFIEDKLADYKVTKGKIVTIDPEKDVVTLGVFKVTPFRVSHSVPDAVGFCIDSPEGKLFHVPDYKFDWTSVDQKPFDVNKAAILASDGALALASDGLGSTNPGYTESENTIEARIEQIVSEAKGQIYFTTISSNISRMQQAINVAIRHKRKVAFVGRSVDSKSDIAKKFGYLHYPNNLVVPARRAAKMRKDQVMYIISGSYGQPGSALYRTATNEHDYLTVGEGDTVIFSGDPAPPGSKTNVDFLVDRLIENNVNVHYYDMQEDLHVSGHGSQEDIKLLFGLIKPKYYIPIGGTVRHNRAYAKLAEDMGAKPGSVFELLPGDVVEYKDGVGQVVERIPVREVLVDGLEIGDVGNVVLRDRKILAREGFVIAIVQYDHAKQELVAMPELITRGFVYEKQRKDFLKEAADKLNTALSKKKLTQERIIKQEAVHFLEGFFYRETGRRPMIMPVVIEV